MSRRRYYVYILASHSRRLYIGVTGRIWARTNEHKEHRGSQFAAKYNIDKLVYYEGFDYVQNAIRREKELKGWVRRKKVELIESVNPDWDTWPPPDSW